jgi:hypothetical protein
MAPLFASHAQASALVRGAYYRLGEDDPGAVASAIGNDPTIDSFGDKLDLTRYGSPRYWADVPARGPLGDSLSMAFANEGLGGPAFPGVYGRSSSLSMIEQGYALETWVKAGPTGLDQIRNNLIAYNGDPASNGFGFFLRDASHGVARLNTAKANCAGFVLLKADVTASNEADQALFRRFGVYGPPTTAFFSVHGGECRAFRLVGFVKADAFRSHLARFAREC